MEQNKKPRLEWKGIGIITRVKETRKAAMCLLTFEIVLPTLYIDNDGGVDLRHLYTSHWYKTADAQRRRAVNNGNPTLSQRRRGMNNGTPTLSQRLLDSVSEDHHNARIKNKIIGHVHIFTGHHQDCLTT